MDSSLVAARKYIANANESSIRHAWCKFIRNSGKKVQWNYANFVFINYPPPISRDTQGINMRCRSSAAFFHVVACNLLSDAPLPRKFWLRVFRHSTDNFQRKSNQSTKCAFREVLLKCHLQNCWPSNLQPIVLGDYFIGLLSQCDWQKLLLMHDNRAIHIRHCSYYAVDAFIGCHGCFQSHKL